MLYMHEDRVHEASRNQSSVLHVISYVRCVLWSQLQCEVPYAAFTTLRIVQRRNTAADHLLKLEVVLMSLFPERIKEENVSSLCQTSHSKTVNNWEQDCFGETIYFRSYATIINWTINKRKNIHVWIVCRKTQGLLLPQLLDRHVLLAVFLHHLGEKTEQS